MLKRKIDNNGKIIVKYTASEAGLATFSTNNVRVGVSVTKWKSVINTEFVKIKTNGQLVSCYLDGPERSISASGWSDISDVIDVYGSYLSEYMPPYNIYTQCNDGIDVRLTTAGVFQAVRKEGGKQTRPTFYAVYLKKGI